MGNHVRFQFSLMPATKPSDQSARWQPLLVALLLVTSGLTACQKSAGPAAARHEDAVPVTVAPVELITLDRTIPVVGTLFAKDEATISAEVEGKVERTMAEFGDRLTNGQVIAQIDTESYQALAQQADANLAKAKASLANAEADWRRVEELRKQNISSASDLDKAVALANQWRAEVQSVEAAAAIARLNLERSQVRAPFDSAVADRIATAGDFMKVGTPLFRVVNDAVLKYIVNAPERYAADIRKEQLVVFTVDAYPNEKFEGKVYLISPQVSTGNRAFAFGALVANAERRLRANTFARGEVLVERNVATAVAPLDAVISFAGVTKVFVVESGLARSRPVQAGRIHDGRQEILAGLKPGEIVVTSGHTKLFDGAKIRVKENPKSE